MQLYFPQCGPALYHSPREGRCPLRRLLRLKGANTLPASRAVGLAALAVLFAAVRAIVVAIQQHDFFS